VANIRGYEWQSFLSEHRFEGSMPRHGSCSDNAIAERFFQLLRREQIKKRNCTTLEQARADIFNYFEMFYNAKRKHDSNNLLSPVSIENQYQQQQGSD
jgi:putative transposase